MIVELSSYLFFQLSVLQLYIKLYAVLGIFLGPLGIIQTIFFSCFVGSIMGVTMILAKKMDRNYAIPFGPAIILVACAQIFLPQFFDKLTKIINIFSYYSSNKSTISIINQPKWIIIKTVQNNSSKNYIN